MTVFNKEGMTENEIMSRTGTFVPAEDSTYVFPLDSALLFQVMTAEKEAGTSQNVLLVGPTGCGKTEFCRQFAAKARMPLLKMDCANVAESSDWFGRIHVSEGATRWEESPFDRVVSQGGHVILLDEINRATPGVLNVLLPLLDKSRATFIQDRKPYPVLKDGGGTVWFATMNEGSAYTGTNKLDRALRGRFSNVVELGYISKMDEINLLIKRTGIELEAATKLVDIADAVRKKARGIDSVFSTVISTRELLNAANMFRLGGVKTLRFSLLNHFDNSNPLDSERAQITEMLKGKFGSLDGAGAKLATASEMISEL